MVFVLGAQLVSQSSAYVPAESFTLLAPQVVASPPRNTLNLQRHYENFQEQVKRCLEVRDVTPLMWLAAS